MTWPREGSREIDEGIIVSVPMDWCKSPTGPVPYKIWAYQREAMNLADTVRQTDDRTHVRESIILRCYGDEPGVGGGVISGTHNAECTPKTWSESVTAQSRNVVRHEDEWWMNHKNTWGQLIYVKDQNAYPTPDVKEINQYLDFTKINKQQTPDIDQYQALYKPPAGVAPELLEMSPGVAGGAGTGLVEAAPGAALLEAAPEIIEGGSLVGPIGTGIAIVIVAGIAIYVYSGSRASQRPDKCPCVVAPYSDLRYVCGRACKQGQAHHIVPDYTLRYGTRAEGEADKKRIKGLPRFGQGMSICMKGNAKDDDTEHYEAHQADKDVAALGMHPDSPSFPLGTAKIEDIKDITKEQAKKARRECADQIEKGVEDQYANRNTNTLARTYFDSRYPPSDKTVPALSKPTIHQ